MLVSLTSLLLLAAALLAGTLMPFAALAALLLLPLASHGAVRSLPPRATISWLMLGWAAWPLATLAWSMAPGLAIGHVAALSCMPLAWLIGISLHRRGVLLPALERLLPALLALLILWAVLQGPNTFTAKPQGPLNDPNAFGALLNMLALPAIGYLLASPGVWRRTRLRAGLLALVAAFGFVQFLIASRGATLALILLLAVLLWFARRAPDFPRKLAGLLAAFLVAFAGAQLVLLDGTIVDRVAHTATHGDHARLLLVQSAWRMILDGPWFGIGFAGFRLLYPRYRPADELGSAGHWVHNDYLQFWLEGGYPMVLLAIALVAWVARHLLRPDGANADDALRRQGWLAGVACVLVQALFNFVFFFAIVSMLCGLYIAASQAPMRRDGPIPRPHKLLATGYGLVLGVLLMGQSAVDLLLDRAGQWQRLLLPLDIVYPSYTAAYWTSVLAPFHPTPHHVMAKELLASYAMMGRSSDRMRQDALFRLERARRLAPCFTPYSNASIVAWLDGEPTDNAVRQAKSVVAEALQCNPYHGLSRFFEGWLANLGSEAQAVQVWRGAARSSRYLVERILLATAVFSRGFPEHRRELSALAWRMVEEIQHMELSPYARPNTALWHDAQIRLAQLDRTEFIRLTAPIGGPSQPQ